LLVISLSAFLFFPITAEKESHLLLTHRNGIEKVWANKLSHQKETDTIPNFLFGVGILRRIPFGFAHDKFTDVVPPEWRDVM